MRYEYLFGPVPSRRLGVSLGVDLVKKKTCNLNCVYCECGRTENTTTERKSYIDKEKVVEEIKDYLKTGNYLDYITFSGWGEPTLNSDIGWIIDKIKKITDIKIAVITNGTLLFENEVKDALLKAQNADKAKSTFLGNMSHEIRTPLNSIIGFAQIINTSNDSDETSKKYSQIIDTSAKALLAILNDVLDI